MTLEVPTLTPVIRKRGAPLGNTNALHHGAPRGNSNALVHGFYSDLNPSPYQAPLQSVRLSSSPRTASSALASKQIVLIGRSLSKQIAQTLALFAPRMLLADTGEELMQWFRPMLKLISARQKVLRSMLVGSWHDRVLFTLARHPMQWVNREFKDRDLRAFPIFPPPDFDKFCADPSSTAHAFRNNTIIPSSAPDLFVSIFFKKPRHYHLSKPAPSPFLTDQQWLGIENSFLQFQKEMDSDRRRRRKINEFPARLLFEALFIKLAFNLSWKALPGIIKMIHPDLPSFPRWTCRSFYRDLYNAGFLQSVYKQLHWHLSVYGGTSLEKLVKKGCFQIDNKSITLAPGVPLSWQNFTALLLLQRGYHNFRAYHRETPNPR